MDIPKFFELMPFVDHLGIELLEVADGHAVGRIDLAAEHASMPDRSVAHGGVAYSLADTVGAAAVVSRVETTTPTIDMRIDYLTPATGGSLRAEADVRRAGNTVATADVEITDGDGTMVATARGTYKTDGGGDDTAWGPPETDGDGYRNGR